MRFTKASSVAGNNIRQAHCLFSRCCTVSDSPLAKTIADCGVDVVCEGCRFASFFQPLCDELHEIKLLNGPRTPSQAHQQDEIKSHNINSSQRCYYKVLLIIFIMEGRGVTNYAGGKPSYAFSTSTTEFDDALMQRGIVTFEQAMMAKGASAEEAKRLATARDVKKGEAAIVVGECESGEEEDYSEDDDEFLQRYRQKRLEELKTSKSITTTTTLLFGEVMHIARPDWGREVNDDSQKVWVVVVLTSHDVERTGCAEEAVQVLAQKFADVKFVSIPSNAAIANWPDERLPTIFLYRHGKLQQEFIGMKRNISANELEWTLAECQALETTLEQAPSENIQTSVRGRGYGSNVFGGTMSQLQTGRFNSDDQDSDEV
jgi:hypothetical protein